jgi:2-oxoglutarate ferredoxin oxidoreductase subunit alpha
MRNQDDITTKQLISGNVAAGEAAIRAGCRFYAGYPITPQNELIAYMADQLPLRDGVFVQAESEVAAINMLYGASAAGVRCMTSSSSPGISLKQEGISYLAGSQLPAVIVNVQRGGPGLGGIGSSQGDYYQSTRGGGHGDYRCPVLAPSTVQEMADLTYRAFDLADIYRTPVIVLSDAMTGQMMEGANLDRLAQPQPPEKPWALTGAAGRPRNIVHSFYAAQEDLEAFNAKQEEKYREIQKSECQYEEINCEDAELLIVAFGSCARTAREVALQPPAGLKERVGLFRPVTVWPFPSDRIAELSKRVKGILTVEMNAGQMVDDVRLAASGECPVHLLPQPGGGIPSATRIVDKLLSTFT